MSGSINLLLLIALVAFTSAINIPLCSQSGVNVVFRDTQGNTDSTTKANLCHDKKFLYVVWQNVDQQIISTFTKCNDPLYKQDAVEIFIASMKSYPINYWEIQVSPKGVLFFSEQTNPSGNCSKFSGDPRDCSLISATGKPFSKGWEANLKVDLNIVLRNEGGNSFYANLFRIDYTTGKPTRYLAMNPTGTPTPCFHVPSKFEKFTLLGMSQTSTLATE